MCRLAQNIRNQRRPARSFPQLDKITPSENGEHIPQLSCCNAVEKISKGRHRFFQTSWICYAIFAGEVGEVPAESYFPLGTCDEGCFGQEEKNRSRGGRVDTGHCCNMERNGGITTAICSKAKFDSHGCYIRRSITATSVTAPLDRKCNLIQRYRWLIISSVPLDSVVET